MLSFLEDDDVALLALPPAPRRALLRAVKAATLSPSRTCSADVVAIALAPTQKRVNYPNAAVADPSDRLGVCGDGGYGAVGGEGEDGEVDKMCLDPITMVI